MYKPRAYRRWVVNEDLVSFEVVEKETDLLISAERELTSQAKEAVIFYRETIENYIKEDTVFYTSLEPLNVGNDAPDIVKAMADAGRKAGVGPMASVAGAMAEFTARSLLRLSSEVIVENGGDIFIRSSRVRRAGIYAGADSPFTGRLAIEIPSSENGIGVCTSSGTVSHSLSFGNADAALIIAETAAFADAMATAVGNIVKSPVDIEKGIGLAKSVQGVRGVLIIVGEKLGSWGEIVLV